MFTNSRSSSLFMQKLQNGRYDGHCLALSVLETIVFSALAIAFSCGMIGCSTSTTPCTGASCQSFTADGGVSGLDGAASGDAGNKAEASNAADALWQSPPEFKNSVPQMCDFSNPPPGLECMKCKWDENHELQGCGYKELNSPAGNKCTKNPWILKAPGEWKLAVNMIIGDECCGYAQACGYGNKPPCDSESVTPKSPRRFVVACTWAIDASSDKTALTECPDGFIFRGLGYSGSNACILEDGTTFSTGVKGVNVTKGKLWWKDGSLYAGFCKYSNFVNASKEYPCHYSDGSVASDKYIIYQKISN